MHRIAVLAVDGVYPFELGIPQRIFGALPDRYEVRTCTVDGRPVQCNADFSITVDHGAELLAEADTVVIPPFGPACPIAEPSAELLAALWRVRPGTRLVSICTGAALLAAAGLLDGRPATTHWQIAAEFRRRYPRVRLDADVLFVDDGDVVTSAGAASGLDTCLHLVRRDHGSAVANRVARAVVVPPWRDGGQAQYIEQPVPEPADGGTAPARQWALRHLDRPITVADLAARSRMSARTFARRFRAESAMSPGRWLVQQRVARARELLETTDLPVEAVAGRVGFATAASLRSHMQAIVGITPMAYRRTFHAAADAG